MPSAHIIAQRGPRRQMVPSSAVPVRWRAAISRRATLQPRDGRSRLTNVVIVNRKGALHWQDVPCREWHRGRSSNGYGQVSIGGGRQQGAHRFVWQTIHGPTSLSVLHHCDNPACFEPLHLFEGTQSVNMLDAQEKGRISPFWRTKREWCKAGHELAGNNVYLRPDGAQACRACHREWSRTYRARRRA